MIRENFSSILFAALITSLNEQPSSAAISQVALNEPCNITAVDFINRVLEINQQQIPLKNGSFTKKDDLGSPDWLFTLLDSSSLYHFGKDTVRIIKLDANHLSGSGRWEIALGFVCSGNQVKKVLEVKSLSSVLISQKGNTLLVTTWKEYRGAAPPQGKKTQMFKWINGAFSNDMAEDKQDSR